MSHASAAAQGQSYGYHRPGSAGSNRGQASMGGQAAQEGYGGSYASSGPSSHGQQQRHHLAGNAQDPNASQDYSLAPSDTQVQEISVLEDDDDESVMSSESDFESDPQLAMAMDPEQQHFYAKQQEQAKQYQLHQRMSGGVAPEGGYQARIMSGEKSKSRRESRVGDDGEEDEDMYSDDGSSSASIPDEEIDFGLTYALHTFLATVEGQASVVKGDSLLLLDDANSYWWLVRVLKTEDVGYIPAENIETPYERLARLNKHRNVDLAAATAIEKAAAEERSRQKGRAAAGFAGKAFGIGNRNRSDRNGGQEGEGRRVEFAPPTYVEHPGKTWSSDEEDSSEGEDEEEADRSLDQDMEEGDSARADADGDHVDRSLGQQQGDDQGMEPDDGVEWADQAARQAQQGQIGQQHQQDAQQQQPPQQAIQPQSNNPFAQRQPQAQSSPERYNPHDPAQAGEDTRRITVTPSVAQTSNGGNGLLPSAVVSNGARNASTQSLVSNGSSGSAHGASSNESPEAQKRFGKIRKSGSQDSLNSVEGKKDKKRGIISGLFSRKNKDKKGVSSSDPRDSEDSFGGAQQAENGRLSEESKITVRAPTPAEPSADSPRGTSHSFRVQQTDQQRMQAYTEKYLSSSPSSAIRAPTASEAAAAVAQSAAAMRLAASMNGATNRPSSIIVSPNPAAPLLNVMRIFAGEHVKSDASFKTVLLNDTTSSTDLIRQAIQRFRLRDAMIPGAENGYFLCVRDVIGEEMELEVDEKPLQVFLDAVQRWSEENGAPDRSGAVTPTVKRSSIASISSVMSLSTHPAIAKLGMNDFSDDSAVKIYLHRRRPGSMQFGQGDSQYSSYASQLSTVREGSPEHASGANRDDHKVQGPGQRYNPSLSINTQGSGVPSPERFSSPSARFTVQVAIYQPDLPDGMVFDPTTDAIVSKQVLRDRLMAGHPTHTRDVPSDSRKRLFMMPRNATVVEAIEQGLERFGIRDGVVDGGDDIEDRGGMGKGGSRVRYCLTVSRGGKDNVLSSSSKLLDAYAQPPTFKPVERSTPEQKRRSREWSYGMGSLNDILPSDPVFVLRRSGRPGQDAKQDLPKGVLRQQQAIANAAGPGTADPSDKAQGQMSPQEIIAAQRAAYRANQSAMLSAHANKSQGVDVLLPDRGTLRSSRLLEPTGEEVVRYSYVDDYGETYDISELLEEEWKDGSPDPDTGYFEAPGVSPGKPAIQRQPTDQSEYVTAPSTPADGLDRRLSRSSVDLLAGAIERSAGKPEGKLQEKLVRVIDKVKSKGAPQIRPAQTDPALHGGQSGGRSTPTSSRSAAAQFADNHRRDGAGSIIASAAPSSLEQTHSQARSTSRQGNMADTAASVNRIVSRHRQQPSIASIMSMSDAPRTSSMVSDANTDSTVTRGDRDRENDTIHAHRDADRDRERASTPLTATSSTHPTPPLGSAIFTRAVASMSPTPREPIRYTDDFGMKTLIGLVEARAREMRPSTKSRKGSASSMSVKGDAKARRMSKASLQSGSSGNANGISNAEVESEMAALEMTRMFWGDRLEKQEMDSLHPDVRAGMQGVMIKLDAWDQEMDELLGNLGDLMGVSQPQR